jgi:chromosomal replication initiator protein
LPLPQELESTWDEIRGELRRDVTDLTFHLWLEPLELAGRDRDVLFVRAPRHIRTLVEERHLPLLRAAGGRALGRAVAVTVVDDDWRPPDREPLDQAGTQVAAGTRGVEALNPRYSFDQFVIGDGNRLAHAAALAVAEQPGLVYNPLFLYGRPGLGKTHLLHAIGNYVRRYGGGLSVRYVTSDAFTTDFVRAVRGDGIDSFKAAFRGVDLLLVDDVQFLAARTRTQEEFFHTFNSLYEAGCQLVVSSDRAPRELTAFERRLSERFGAGLVAELDVPDAEVRLAILRKRVAFDGIKGLDETTLREIATQMDSSVRELEGALVRVVAYASLRGEKATPELAQRLLTRTRRLKTTTGCTVLDIQRTTAIVLGVSQDSLLAHDRRPPLVFARQIAMYLARELTDATLPAIGAAFGGRNHSTVLHAHRNIRAKAGQSPKTADVISQIEDKLHVASPDRSD